MRWRGLTIAGALVGAVCLMGAGGVQIRTAKILDDQTATVTGTEGATSPTIQMKTVIFKLAPQTGGAANRSAQSRALATWSADVAAADTIINLSTSELMYDFVARRLAFNHAPADSEQGLQAETDSNYHNPYIYTKQGVGSRFPNTTNAANTNQQYILFWADFGSHIPANARILSATMRLKLRSNTAVTAYQDTVCIVADTTGNHYRWRQGPFTYNVASTYYPNQKAASWRNQIQPSRLNVTGHSAVTGRNYPGPDAFPSTYADSFRWSPRLDSTKRTLDFGPRSYGYIPSASVYAESTISVDFMRPLQYDVNGANVHAYWLMYIGQGGAGTSSYAPYMWATMFQTAATGGRPDSLKCPYFVVQYATNQQDNGGPWAGKEAAFAFVSDDGVIDANDAWAEEWASRGYKYTIAVCQSQRNNTNRWDYDDLVRWNNLGMSIAPHGRFHTATGEGLTKCDRTTTTGYDSLVWAMSRAWIDSGMALASGATRDSSGYAADRTIGQVLALPYNAYNLRVVQVADSLGYLGLRCAKIGGVSAFAPTPADTLGAHTGATGARRTWGMAVPRKMNLMLCPTYLGDTEIFGTPGSEFTEAQTKRIVRLLIEDAAVRHRNGLWVLYSHSLMDNPESYGSGISAAQMGYLLDAIEEAGNVRVIPLADAMRFWQGHGIEVDHPAFGAAAWQSGLAGDRKVWWEANDPSLP